MNNKTPKVSEETLKLIVEHATEISKKLEFSLIPLVQELAKYSLDDLEKDEEKQASYLALSMHINSIRGLAGALRTFCKQVQEDDEKEEVKLGFIPDVKKAA